MKKIIFYSATLIVTVLLYGCGGKNENKAGKFKSLKSSLLGCTIDSVQYKKAKIYEPLKAASRQRKLAVQSANRVVLDNFAPQVGSQGGQGSCVAWSSAYAARSILYAVAQNSSAPQAFSPAYVYNQIKIRGCEDGSYVRDAMELMQKKGVPLLQDFPYDENNCSRKPGSNIDQKAERFRIRGYVRLSDGDLFNVNTEAIRQHLSKNAPVVMAMPVSGDFQSLNTKLYEPTREEYEQLRLFKAGRYGESGMGGHAMCIVGYDDNLAGGAFRVMNSWGKSFGENGFFWIRYKDFAQFGMEAYGIYSDTDQKPRRPDSPDKPESRFSLEAKIGLVEPKSGELMSMRYSEISNSFITNQAYAPGDKFKVEITNSQPCYVYVLGMETDGSAYRLFPYTPKHSPYCGITGTRIFPKDYSMQLDNQGRRDMMAVILTANEIDIDRVVKRANNSRENSFEKRLSEALGNDVIPANEMTLAGGDEISVKINNTTKNAALLICKIKKIGGR